jgi:hypothetical protein
LVEGKYPIDGVVEEAMDVPPPLDITDSASTVAFWSWDQILKCHQCG